MMWILDEMRIKYRYIAYVLELNKSDVELLFRILRRERAIKKNKSKKSDCEQNEGEKINFAVRRTRSVHILQRWYCVRCHSVAVRHFIDKSACSLSCTDKKLIIHRQMRFDKKINDILVTAAGAEPYILPFMKACGT